LDETVRCVVEEGFAAASAKHIAERAGVTWGVIQYHFGDRDRLLSAVVDDGFDDLRTRMAAVDISHGTTHERVTALVRAAWDAFSTPTSRASLEILVGTRSQRPRQTSEHLAAMGRELVRLGRDLVADQSPARGATAVGDLLWATLRGLVLTHMVVRSAPEPTRELAALVDLLIAHLETEQRP
jgi:AcrR family transcriptional regulator